ncbi:hypothetical protein NQ314_003021 [Rhamnusium bicolor]|uniref:DDE Tnp4 domain-containing protein n=1 Tax=Rhamnusium bicolor TaxID=1586634 RepID=A0AAV8ZQ67_9CUCU|nr:hypothetical protein NQ314_003021 [Rhamnusium bicolor]
MATGESLRSLMYNYRVLESTISLFVPVVCEELKEEYLKVRAPMYRQMCIQVTHLIFAAAEWLEIATDFETTWNAPNVICALDGKHIAINAPKDQGSAYFNYKKQHSIVLLALVYAKYNLLT